MKAIPAPSPNGTNNERLFLVKMPRQPLGALDAVKLHGDEDAPDLAALHAELSEMLAEVLSGPELEHAINRLDECLGGAAREYDGQDEEENDLPRNSREGGMGGRVSEYEREARDRKRMAGDRRRRQLASDAADERAEQSFNDMFPEAARIRIGGF